jgi:hypothetical protein
MCVHTEEVRCVVCTVCSVYRRRVYRCSVYRCSVYRCSLQSPKQTYTGAVYSLLSRPVQVQCTVS